jgi:hypothetical protein
VKWFASRRDHRIGHRRIVGNLSVNDTNRLSEAGRDRIGESILATAGDRGKGTRSGPYAIAICGRRADVGPMAQGAAQAAQPAARVPSALQYSVATCIVETPDRSLDRDTDRRDSDMHVDAQRHDVAKKWLLVASQGQGRRPPARAPADLGPADLSVRSRKEYRRAGRLR